MFTRSLLSVEKDKFNFACNLASELESHLEKCGSDYPQDIFNGISKLQMRCGDRCLVTINDLQEGAYLIGTEKFKQLSLLAMMKAKLETDLVNSM
ncbi:MAG: hypothetical protein HC930_11365 [Hydrococcus sp. SU_1_0]|nr:hypothetical protein [Hydrococcus sp. SU_1_0]